MVSPSASACSFTWKPYPEGPSAPQGLSQKIPQRASVGPPQSISARGFMEVDASLTLLHAFETLFLLLGCLMQLLEDWLSPGRMFFSEGKWRGSGYGGKKKSKWWLGYVV